MNRRHAGFSLLDTLVGASLALVSVTMAVPLLHWCTLTLHQTEREAISNAVFDHAIDLLRRDVWQATRISQHGHVVTLISPTTGLTQWLFNNDGTIRRIASGSEQSWSAAPGTTFTVDSALLTVIVPASPGREASTFAIVCPALLCAEAHS